MTQETLNSSRSAWTRQVGSCSVPICERDRIKASYCGAHYQRWRKYGDVRPNEPVRPKQAVWGIGKCSIDECEKPSRKRGWCMMHYDRWLDHGDPLYEARPQGHKRVSDHGYVWVHSGGLAPISAEHRLAWEAKYGSLLPGQNIHHKNGNRADNRYENLELWDTTQPAGQRPEDKVEYAIQMLERYAPNLLA